MVGCIGEEISPLTVTGLCVKNEHAKPLYESEDSSTTERDDWNQIKTRMEIGLLWSISTLGLVTDHGI
jgi:hypothetical protein